MGAVQVRQCWLLRARVSSSDDPLMIFTDLADGVESRRVELWLDGRRGFASRYASWGGTTLPAVQSDSPEQISAGFDAAEVPDDAFEIAWQSALVDQPVTTLWRTVSVEELAALESSGWRRFPHSARSFQRQEPDPAAASLVVRCSILSVVVDQWQGGPENLCEVDVLALNDHIVGPITIIDRF